MRITLATCARGPWGGVESYLRGLAPALIARGHELALLYERGTEPETEADPYAGCAAAWDAETLGIETAVAAARAWQPDLVWMHGLASAGLEAALLDVAPALLFAHNYDGTCATSAKFQRWPHAQPCGRAMGVACIAINFSRHCGHLRPVGFVSGFRRQRQRAAAFAQYRQILVASQHMAEAVRRQIGGPQPPVHVLPYPCLQTRLPAPPHRPGPPRHVLMLSRLTVAKGGHYLLHAAASAQQQLGRRLQLTVAGDGPERTRLEKVARDLDLDATFPGWIAPSERERRLATADLLALPSLWPEPFGMVGLEAAAQAVPSVAYATGGIPEWLHAGENGELAPAHPPTIAGLAAALVRALGDADHWQRLRQEAWRNCAHFSLDRHLDRLEARLRANEMRAHA